MFNQYLKLVVTSLVFEQNYFQILKSYERCNNTVERKDSTLERKIMLVAPQPKCFIRIRLIFILISQSSSYSLKYPLSTRINALTPNHYSRDWKCFHIIWQFWFLLAPKFQREIEPWHHWCNVGHV